MSSLSPPPHFLLLDCEPLVVSGPTGPLTRERGSDGSLQPEGPFSPLSFRSDGAPAPDLPSSPWCRPHVPVPTSQPLPLF